MKSVVFKLFSICILLSLFACQAVGDEIEQIQNRRLVLPKLLSDNMVLQRDTLVKLWGWTNPNEQVTILPEWSDNEYICSSDDKGKWEIHISTPLSAGPYKILIKDKDEEIVLENVLIGEVWVCSGQSNMAMVLNGNSTDHVDNSENTILDADNYKGKIRIFKMNTSVTSEKPLPDLRDGAWIDSESSMVGNCSAVAYFFAKALYEDLNVPIAIVVNAKGGSNIEAWMDESTYSSLSQEEIKEDNEYKKPSRLFNALVNPLVGFTIRGVLWYQGEANVKKWNTYQLQLEALVKSYRKYWDNPDMPFFFAQIAPYSYGNVKGEERPRLNEAQYKAFETLSNVGIISTVDAGAINTIHPPKKEIIGERFKDLALSFCYNTDLGGKVKFINTDGKRKIAAIGPQLTSVEFQSDFAVLAFDQKINFEQKIVGFEIAGKDKIFYDAEVDEIPGESQKIRLHSKYVSEIISVRYNFRNYLDSNLRNIQNVPSIPFRTDNW